MSQELASKKKKMKQDLQICTQHSIIQEEMSINETAEMQDFFSSRGDDNRLESFAGTYRGYFESSRTIDLSMNESFRQVSRTFVNWDTARKPICEKVDKKCNEIEELDSRNCNSSDCDSAMSEIDEGCLTKMAT